MRSTTAYNESVKFTYELNESRLRKCVNIIDKLPPGDLLDIGCSNGVWAAYWAQKGWRCSGVDIDEEHIAISRSPGVLKKQVREHGFTIVLHRGNWVPFLPQRFLSDLQVPALSITGDWLPNLSMDIIIVAQRP